MGTYHHHVHIIIMLYIKTLKGKHLLFCTSNLLRYVFWQDVGGKRLNIYCKALGITTRRQEKGRLLPTKQTKSIIQAELVYWKKTKLGWLGMKNTFKQIRVGLWLMVIPNGIFSRYPTIFVIIHWIQTTSSSIFLFGIAMQINSDILTAI